MNCAEIAENQRRCFFRQLLLSLDDIPPWLGIESAIRINKRKIAWVVNTSRNESLFLASPACMAGVLHYIRDYPPV